jgi:hypothetical protein
VVGKREGVEGRLRWKILRWAVWDRDAGSIISAPLQMRLFFLLQTSLKRNQVGERHLRRPSMLFNLCILGTRRKACSAVSRMTFLQSTSYGQVGPRSTRNKVGYMGQEFSENDLRFKRTLRSDGSAIYSSFLLYPPDVFLQISICTMLVLVLQTYCFGFSLPS